jgi:nuclear transport factor 2 (NTF2) superfamily protein
MTTRRPLPLFTRETAIQKVRLGEDGWNSRDPEKVALAYALDFRWRNRSEFVNGTQEIIAFLTREWTKELGYRPVKELWPSTEIVLLCGSHMSGTITQEIGFGRTAMRIGNSMKSG